MENSLPKNWRWVKLGEACELIMGQSPPSSTYTSEREGLPFFQGKADFGDFYPTVRAWCIHPIKIAEERDILISVRAPVGPVNMNNLKCCIGRGLTAIRCKNNAINWFIFWYLRFIEKEITALGSGSTFGAIIRDDLASIGIPLPPLEDQRRIAAKIQELMQEIRNLQSSVSNQNEAANALPSVYLREVFESPEAKKWERKRLGEVCEFLDSKRIPVNDAERQRRIAGKKESELYPYYGANGQVGWIDDYIFDEELVLLAEDGGFFGSCDKPIAYKVNGEYWVNNHAHVLRAKENIVSIDWLYYSLAIRPDVIEFTSGTTRLKLNQEQASLIPLLLPPLREQKNLVIKLKEKMEQAENLQSALRNQQSTINALPQSILRKAFRGEM